MDIHSVQEELKTRFPEYDFFISRRLQGKCLVAKKSKYHGADIFVKEQEIIIEATIPEWKTRLMLGAGVAHRKITDKNFSEVALRVEDFLGKKYKVRLRH